MANSHGSFIWYELMTPDPDAATAFYQSVIGWTIGGQPSGPIDYRMIAAPDGNVGGVMRLSAEMQQGGARPMWLGYVGVDDVDAAHQRATAAGAASFVPPTDIPGIGRFALLADPQGAPIYIMRGNSDEASTAFSATDLGHVSWNELASTDQDGALAFYGSQFGWTSTEAMPMGEMGEYKFIDHDGTRLGAVMRQVPHRPSGWCFYFRVDDIERAKGAVEQGGGTVMHGPVEVPGGDHIIVASDPHGAVFGAVGAKA